MNISKSLARRARVRITPAAAGVIFAWAATLATPASAIQPVVQQNYITLSLPGIVGDTSHVPNAPGNAIDVLSISFGASYNGSTANLQDISITKPLDGASPPLFLHLVTAGAFATATINFWQSPTTGVNYTKTYTIYLTNAALTSLASGASGGGGNPVENFSLSFTTIAFQDNVTGAVSCYNVVTKASSTGALTC